MSGISALSGVTATAIVGTVTTADVETVGLRTDVAVTVTDKASSGAVAGAVYFIGVPLAVVMGEIVPHGELDGKERRNVQIKRFPGLQYMDFSSSSKAIFMTSMLNGVATLLYIDMTGRARSIWQPTSITTGFAVSSRDGRRLAIAGGTLNSNVWLVKNF